MSQFVIFTLNNHTLAWERLAPTLDGKPRVFLRRKDAEDYAYDYQIAGGRNQRVEYRKEPLTPEARAAGAVYRAWEPGPNYNPGIGTQP